MRGRFITFEGGEGTGKSTHAELLAERLRALALNVVLTREPGGSVGAEIIRHVLLNGAAQAVRPGCRSDVVRGRAGRSRRHHHPAGARARRLGLCDRFIDSTRVYQGAVGQADPRIIRALERITVGDTVPDLTLLLDSPGVGLATRGRAPGAARTPIGSNRKRPISTSSCATPTGPLPNRIRSAAC